LAKVLKLRAKMLREWSSWINEVVNAIKEVLPDAEVYIIGSVACGEAIGSSDLDLLIVSENSPDKPKDRATLIARIEDQAQLPLYHPIEFHFIKPQDKYRYLAKSKKYIRLA